MPVNFRHVCHAQTIKGLQPENSTVLASAGDGDGDNLAANALVLIDWQIIEFGDRSLFF